MTEKVKKHGLNAYAKGLLTIALPLLLIIFGEMILSRSFAAPSFLFSYSVLEDGTAALTRYKGFSSYVIFPQQIDGRQVTVIDDVFTFSDFDVSDSLRGAEVPEGVKMISGTFLGCEKLKSVKLPQSLEVIGHAAFAFSGIAEVDIPNNVKEIGDIAFYRCTDLYGVKLPDSLEYLDGSTFIYSGLYNACESDFFCIGDRLCKYMGSGGRVLFRRRYG
ncbi:MAG: leucine-rich repeat domain-containing protein [Ruminococcus sp.]|nr:leucine-rich repeat domain-containing protein [Ruminococcus sp.]